MQDGLLLLAAAAAVSEVVGEGEVVAVVVVVLILTKWRGVDRRVAVPQLRTRNVGGALLVPASEASKGERRRESYFTKFWLPKLTECFGLNWIKVYEERLG